MPAFTTEADLVLAWLAHFKRANHRGEWLVYPETAGWDLLLVHADGYQIGIEAKLSLNAKVLAQALAGSSRWRGADGPDYRAVVVPADKCQLHMMELAAALGIWVLQVKPPEADRFGYALLQLPDQNSGYCRWPAWLPSERCSLPEYVPDVAAGVASPVQLTQWKVKAIKLMIVLERRGYVTRADMRALQISPTMWCQPLHGFLTPAGDRRGYVAGKRTPDLKAQHPTNWAQIEADAPKWLESCAIVI